MKKNNKVLINFYEINECGHIFYVQWDESSTEIERGNVIVYEIVEKELRAITNLDLQEKCCQGKDILGFIMQTVQQLLLWVEIVLNLVLSIMQCVILGMKYLVQLIVLNGVKADILNSSWIEMVLDE